jgi:hypothetical protein
VAWLPVGGLIATLLRLSAWLPSWPDALVVAVPASLAYAFVCLSAFYLCRAVPLDTAPLRLVGTHSMAAASSAAVWVLLVEVWTRVLGRVGILAAGSLGGRAFQNVAVVLLLTGLLLYLLAIALHYVLLTIEASREAEHQALTFKVLSRDAELKALRAQIQPHFLFNSLNSISALTISDPTAARRMCVLLADFLRGSLTLGARERIPLAEELAYVEMMLAIEQVRFGDRLDHELRVEEAARECQIPPLILQPLVENGITHGIATLLDGGKIRIEGRLRSERLELVVENPRDPDASTRPGTGVGLENVRRRVAAVYGKEGQVEVRRDDGWFRVELRLPMG